MTRAMLLCRIAAGCRRHVRPISRSPAWCRTAARCKPGDAFVAIGGLRRARPGFRRPGAQRRCRRDPVRTAGAGRHAARPADAIAVPGLRARIGAMADRFHGQPSRAMTMVGVTGTNGKTSTVQLLAQAWTLLGTTQRQHRHARRRPVRRCRADRLHHAAGAAAARAARANCATPARRRWRWKSARTRSTRVASMACISMSRCSPTSRATTSTTTATWRAYGAAKARLFAWPGLRAAVINLDDAFGRELLARLPPGRAAASASVRSGAAGRRARREHRARRRRRRASTSWSTTRGSRCSRRCWAASTSTTCSRWPACCIALGEAPQAIAATLARLQPIAGRMNRLGGDATARRCVVGRLRAHARCAGTGAGIAARACARRGWSACSVAAANATAASVRRWPRSPSALPTS